MSAEEQQRTILLCKPSCQEVHQTIVQELQASGLILERHLFNLTPEQAIALVLKYPSVKGRITDYSHSRGNATMSIAHGTAPAATNIAESDETSDKTTELPEFIKTAQRHRHQDNLQRQQQPATTPGHRLLAHIQLLAQGNRARPATANTTTPTTATVTTASVTPGGVTAGLKRSAVNHNEGGNGPSSTLMRRLSTSEQSDEPLEEKRRMGASNHTTLPSHRFFGNRGTPSSSSRGTAAARRHAPLSSFSNADTNSCRLALDTIIDHPALEDPLVRQHVEHLVQDGTNLVLLVRGVDAIERLVQLCGPDEVAEARRVAPKSWIARLGIDDVWNAVYAPRTLTDAQSAVHTLFKLSSNEHVGRGARQQQQQQQSLQALSSPVKSPCGFAEVSPLPPLTFASLLPRLRAQVDPQHRLSYYTGVSAATASLSEPSMPVAATTTGTDHVRGAITFSMGAAQGELSAADTGTAHKMQATTTTTLSKSATARFSSATPYPKRRERLDELDTLLHQRAVDC